MADTATPLIFDGHNELIWHIMSDGGRRAVTSLDTGRDGALDLQKMRDGGYGGGFFSIRGAARTGGKGAEAPTVDPAGGGAQRWGAAVQTTFPLLGVMLDVQRHGYLQICRSVREIRQCFATQTIAAALHLDSAECIDPDFYVLDLAHDLGVRSLRLAGERPNAYATGVPLRPLAGSDTSDGLSENGINLVRRCDALGIMVDVSQLTVAGFWDVARFYTKPLVACQANANTVCASGRNLTDSQLDAIRETAGVVGLSFEAALVRPDGRDEEDTSLANFMSHLEYVIERVGEDCVALGSNFDGARLISPLNTADKLTSLRGEMMRRHYGERLIGKLCADNWFRVLEKTWGY